LKKLNYLQNLNYTLGDEDSIVEYELLPEKVDHVVAIAGSGGRILPLIAKQPKQITCIDLLDEQLYITELRNQAMKKLDLNKFRAFLGYPPYSITPQERKRIFDNIEISDNARRYLYRLFSKNKWTEIIYIGKFEKTMLALSKINVLLTGKGGRGIFKCDNLIDQQTYYKTKFPQSKWNTVLFLLETTGLLKMSFCKGNQLKKNTNKFHYTHFKNTYHAIFNNIWVNSSFLAHLWFWGKVTNIEGNPIEADERIYDLAKSYLGGCTINYLKDDIVKFIAGSPAKSIDFVSFSDVPSFIEERENDYLQLIKPALSNQSTVVVRGGVKIIQPDTAGFINLKNDYEDLLAKETTQLWEIDIYKPMMN
jgi:S-adenosylmethionine-diacylglycerol 3-amino-3-carboxypropyl transferase